MRRLGIVSLGVVAPGLFLVISSCIRSQPTSCIAPAFFTYGIPVYVHFYVKFWFILSNLRPPVVVAFGHPLPFLWFSAIPWRFWPIFRYDVLYKFLHPCGLACEPLSELLIRTFP
jgi:hypothetical protein